MNVAICRNLTFVIFTFLMSFDCDVFFLILTSEYKVFVFFFNWSINLKNCSLENALNVSFELIFIQFSNLIVFEIANFWSLFYCFTIFFDCSIHKTSNLNAFVRVDIIKILENIFNSISFSLLLSFFSLMKMKYNL